MDPAQPPTPPPPPPPPPAASFPSAALDELRRRLQGLLDEQAQHVRRHEQIRAEADRLREACLRYEGAVGFLRQTLGELEALGQAPAAAPQAPEAAAK